LNRIGKKLKPKLRSDFFCKPGVIQDTVFEIQFNAPERYRFHLKAANGQIIAVSQSYLSKQAAKNGIVSMKMNAPLAKIIDQTVAVT
jgi:hypothetical protein